MNDSIENGIGERQRKMAKNHISNGVKPSIAISVVCVQLETQFKNLINIYLGFKMDKTIYNLYS